MATDKQTVSNQENEGTGGEYQTRNYHLTAHAVVLHKEEMRTAAAHFKRLGLEELLP